MNKKIIIFLIFILLVGLSFFFFSRNKERANSFAKIIPLNNLLKSQPTPSPTPTPIIINENSNLLEELENSTPADYSEEFNNLKAKLAD